MSSELWRQSAATLARSISDRDVTARAVVESHLARIAAIDPYINAMPKVLSESALTAADAADRLVAEGAPLGALHGVPFTIKANIDLTGDPTTQGVTALANAVPNVDHPMVERMKLAGAIPLGRTNMPDLGLRLHTDSGLYGLTMNPWDRAYTVGGSSGGEAAALATGMTPLGLGNDIGGSLRNPAFCCGVASLKPSFGRIPTASALAPRPPQLVEQLMAVQGPMARTVGDLRIALEVLAGPHPRDPFSSPAPVVGPPITAPAKVALVTEPAGGRTAPAIRDNVRAAAVALADAGFEVEEVSPPLLEDAHATWARWIAWEMNLRHDDFARLMSGDAFAFWTDFIHLIGISNSPADHVALLQTRYAIALEWSMFFARYPIILGPTWCLPQFQHGYDLGAGGAARILELMRFVTPMNLLGLPVVCVPTGIADGLPLGVQVIADRYREDVCLHAAAAIEARLGTITPIDVTV